MKTLLWLLVCVETFRWLSLLTFSNIGNEWSPNCVLGKIRIHKKYIRWCHFIAVIYTYLTLGRTFQFNWINAIVYAIAAAITVAVIVDAIVVVVIVAQLHIHFEQLTHTSLQQQYNENFSQTPHTSRAYISTNRIWPCVYVSIHRCTYISNDVPCVKHVDSFRFDVVNAIHTYTFTPTNEYCIEAEKRKISIAVGIGCICLWCNMRANETELLKNSSILVIGDRSLKQ